MKKKERKYQRNVYQWLIFSIMSFTVRSTPVVTATPLGVPHLGTFEGGTTFTTQNENRVQAGLWLEVMDEEGNLTEYESEQGIITIPNTQEGAYVTQAKLLGQTKYIDQDTGEVLESFEEGRTLALVSPETPTLKITGRNLFDYSTVESGQVVWSTPQTINLYDDGWFAENSTTGFRLTECIKVKPNTRYYASFPYPMHFMQYDKNGTLIKGSYPMVKEGSVVVSKDTHYVNLFPVGGISQDWTQERREQFRESWVSEETPLSNYEPYQSNELSFSETFTLRGIKNKKDSFNLVDGLYTQEIETQVMTGEEDWILAPHFINKDVIRFDLYLPNLIFCETHEIPALMSSYYPTLNFDTVYHGRGIGITQYYKDCLVIFNGTQTMNDFKAILKQHPFTIQYAIAQGPTKTLKIASTYTFPMVNKSFVQLNGTVTPTVLNITLPSESLVFAIDPNQEMDSAFISPEFEITNASNAPLSVNLTSFEQVQPVLTDVLPSYYDSWENLTKDQSQYIALGLIASPSSDWLTQSSTTYYVGEQKETELGVIKPKGTVNFGFKAYHGQAFEKALTLQYRMTFTFELMD